MNKIHIYFILILALLCGCSANKIGKEENNYTNEKYGFSLNFPDEIIYSDNFCADDFIDKEESDDFNKVSFIYVQIHPDRLDVSSVFRMFYINIYEKPCLDITGEIIAENDKYIYTYYDPNYGKQIENTMAEKLYERFSGYFPDIKKSFKLIEQK